MQGPAPWRSHELLPAAPPPGPASVGALAPDPAVVNGGMQTLTDSYHRGINNLSREPANPPENVCTLLYNGLNVPGLLTQQERNAVAHLTVSLLGTFHVTLDGQPVTAFQSDKGRGLLAYLAVESAMPHRRERLAGLLWPERSEVQARHSLSQALFNLRRLTGDDTAPTPCLLVTPQTIQWNPAGDCWVDVAAFTELLAGPPPQLLEEAVALYQGPFLAGFSLPDGVPFEEWALLLRKPLVQRQPNARYSLHQVARQYAQERLHADPPAAARAEDRYAIYFAAWLHEQGERMAGPQQKDAFDTVAADFENCRQAWLLSIERGYHDLANQALEGLYGYNMARMIVEIFGDLMRAGLERLPADLPNRAAALLGARLLAFQGCDMFWRSVVQPERCREALALVEAQGLHDQMGLAWPLLMLINHYAAAVDPARGLAMAQEAMQALRRGSDPWTVAMGLNLAAHTLWGCGLRTEACEVFLESAAISRQCGDRLLLAHDLTAAARITFYQHRWDEAQDLYEESYALFQDLDAAPDAAVCLESLGELACAKGDYRLGLERFRQAGALLAEAGDVQPGYVPLQHWQSMTQARMGELAEARRLREQMLHEELQGGRLRDAFYSAVELAEVWRIAGDLAEAQRAIGMGHGLLVGMELVDSWKANAYGT